MAGKPKRRTLAEQKNRISPIMERSLDLPELFG
jgi:hypothetical protein